MQKCISNRIIRKLNPCYDPKEVVIDENEKLPIKDWIIKYRNRVKCKNDIIWLICNKIFMSNKDMRLFAVWCAREALKLVENPDIRSIEACNIAEKYANGLVNKEELAAAYDAARAAAYAGCNAAANAAAYAACNAAANAAAYAACNAAAADAAYDAACNAAYDAAWNAAAYAAYDAAYAACNATRDAQIDKLLTYFE